MDAVANRAPLDSALRKARRRILPLLALGYLIAYMDRVNISFAAESMNRDLHFSPHVYGLGAGLFFVSYALCEVPSNWLMLRVGARRWLARIMFTWGVLAVAMVLVSSRPSFYVMRMLLGTAEAGYFPGVMYYLTLWFPAKERARAISWFYVSLPLSSTVMGSVAGLLLRLNGRLGMHGWQWLLLVEGMPAVMLSVAMWFGLSERPAAARWLTDAEREALEAELSEARPAGRHAGASALLMVLRDSRVWVMGLFCFCMLGSNYALNFFLPQVLRMLTGTSAQTVGLLIAASGVLAAAAMLLNAAHSDWSGERGWHTMVPTMAIGALMLFAGARLHGAAAAGALLLSAAFYSGFQGPMLALVMELFHGDGAALTIATVNMCGIVGGFAGPYWMGWVRELTGGYALGIGALCVPWMIATGCVAWVSRRRIVAASDASLVMGAELMAATEKSL